MGQSGSTLEQQRSPFDESQPPVERKAPPTAPGSDRLTLIPTVLQWSHGGRLVYVTGTFNNWAERIPMRQSRTDFTVCLNLPVGTFQYKFIVDNEWRFSPSQPLVQDAQGNVNNCITVLDEEDFMRDTGGGPQGGQAAGDGKFGQVVDDETLSTAKDPQPLPVHLTKVVLNSRPITLPPTMAEEIEMPLHCALLHMCWQPPTGPSDQERQVAVVATTYRYRSKFVSCVYYRPTRLRPGGHTDWTSAATGNHASALPAHSGASPAPMNTAGPGQQLAPGMPAVAAANSTASAPRPPSLMQIDEDSSSGTGSNSQMAL
mmetsp:Transcript_22847/g.76714  ORF Transcript_22847/g.76714 Transcript_22847/m.76714 type:complete len:316 (+) Transcript_22847:85-1032(+)